ncbi:MAG: winged helix-turn-helix domain-containing protein [Thermoleophilia bacterium]
MDFHILGPLEARDQGRVVKLGGAKQRALLAVLLLHRGETLSADRLIDELWGADPPATAAKTVQVYVSRLRKALSGGDGDGSSGLIVTREHGYELELDPERVEVARRHFAASPHGDRIELRLGPALESVAELGDERFDLVFIDADKEGYPDYLEASLRLVRPGSLILGDYTIRGGSVLDPQEETARATREFNRRIAEDPRLSGIVLPLIRERIDGITIARVS